LEGNTLNTGLDFDEMMDEADSIIVIVERGERLEMAFTQNLTEMEVLDILAFTTAQFYEVAEGEEPPSLH
jgi:predicted GTPase